MPDDSNNSISRRTFVGDSAKVAAAFVAAPMIVPRHILGGPGYQPPSRTLNVACVGIGGMGMNNMLEVLKAGENVVAICDVDFGYVERSLAGRLRPAQGQTTVPPEGAMLQAAYTKAEKFSDFREMLAKRKDIDAVVIATPDHMHATIAHAAMLAGKHVYVQKPLTYSVYEARLLARTARETKVVTQMGNQGHSMEGTRRIMELIAAGVIGPVREVHVWTDRPLRYWPQGIPRPVSPAAAPAASSGSNSSGSSSSGGKSSGTVTAGVMPTGTPVAVPANSAAAQQPAPPRWSIRTVDNAILKAMAENPQTPPPGLDWDRFLGVAKAEAYHPVYHPFSWRGWPEFGVSAIGDMGAHLIDQPYWALGLTYPTAVVASSTPWGGTQSAPGSYPLAMTAQYDFAARGSQPAVKLHWYDGGLMALVAPEIPRPGGDGGGGIFVGDKGYITYETYGNNPKVYPESAAAAAERVPKTFARVTTTHEANWTQAIKGEATISSPFEYAARLTETMLLPIVALKAGQGRQIQYDADAMRITNIPEANQYLTREYRAGWEL